MKRTLLGWIVLFVIGVQGNAQHPELDSLVISVGDLPVEEDTMQVIPFTVLPFDQEYIPANDSPDLLADRLSCLEQQIPLTYNDRVHAFINYFTIKDRDYTRMVMRRMELYFPLFEKYLAKYNLPEELKYLSIIESGLNPRAVSRVRAVGLWQFMAPTGRYFGLHSDWYIDDRMDPEKSTEAACKYLSQLYNMFHDWELALAAYNSGPGNVRKAIRKSGYKKKFWQIYPYLPRETRAYLPQFVAITYALNYADKHNILEPNRDLLVAADTLAVHKFLHFETFAKLTGTCLEDMQKLNPSVQRNAIPETGKTYIIRVPLQAKLKLDSNRLAILDSASRVGRKELEMLARKTTGSTYGREMVKYRVRSGDVLGAIALRHHVRVDDIKKWNNLGSNLIRSGQQLNIWVMPQFASPIQPVAIARSNPKSGVEDPLIEIPPSARVYIVQPGDTLWDISRKFEGLTIEKIKTLNKLNSNKLQPGQKLIIG
jgi:membrane-bound lytic murein transglycosylase D